MGTMAATGGAIGVTRTRLELLLIGLAAIGPWSLNIFKPCLPWIKADLGASTAIVQLGLSLSILAAAVATLGSVGFVDRVGRRPVVLACLALYVAGSLASAAAPTAAWLIVGRIVQAASSSVGLATARAIIHDRHGAGRAAPVIAQVTFAAVLAVLLAPALGGLLIDRIGWRAVFAASAAIGAALLVAALHGMDESRGSRALERPFAGAGRLLASRVFLGYSLQSSLHFALYFAFTSSASYLLVERLGRSAAAFGLWFVVLAAAAGLGLLAAGRLAARIPNGRLAAIGSLVVCLASLIGATILLRGELTPLRLFGPPTLAAIGIGLALPGSNAGVMEVDPSAAGTASSLLSFMQMAFAAGFAQLVAIDVADPTRLLAVLLLVGGSGSFAAGLLSARDGAAR